MTNCPRCNSHSPKLHPAVQYGGEVSICPDAYHTTDTERATIGALNRVHRLIGKPPYTGDTTS